MRRPAYLLLAFAVMAMTSCGDKSTEPDQNAEVVAAMEHQTSVMVAQFINLTGDGFSYVDSGGPALARHALDTLYSNFDSVTCWWTVYVEGTFIFDFTHSDSLRFLDFSQNCQQYPDTGTYFLDFRRDGTRYFERSVDSSFYAAYHLVADYVGVHRDTTALDGNWRVEYENEAGSDSAIFEFECDYDSILFVIYQPDNKYRPILGTLTLTLHCANSADGTDVTVTVIVSFGDSGYHGIMTLDNRTYHWNVTWQKLQDYENG